MADMLTQAEIDALLNKPSGGSDASEKLSSQEKDALGEIGNISIGTSATTLSTLLGQKVTITTPSVDVMEWSELRPKYSASLIAVKVEYVEGLKGGNYLLMEEDDVKIITDLMMGGDGKNVAGEISDLHLSAIGEAMNQMMGSSATSMSSMIGKRIDISPPKAFKYSVEEDQLFEDDESGSLVVEVAFKLKIGELIDSRIMQLLPIHFAKSLVNNLMHESNEPVKSKKPEEPQNNNHQPERQTPQNQDMGGGSYDQGYEANSGQNSYNNAPNHNLESGGDRNRVNVQPAMFQSFDDGHMTFEKKNIGLIMDVSLEVTVELGRTNKQIRDILEFGPGSIIELDKLAGEPVDILVNGKSIAKGEVVVIDESFGVRITDIIHPSKRL